MGIELTLTTDFPTTSLHQLPHTCFPHLSPDNFPKTIYYHICSFLNLQPGGPRSARDFSDSLNDLALAIGAIYSPWQPV